LVEPGLRQRENGQGIGLVFDRALHPQHRIEVVIGRNILRGSDRNQGEAQREGGEGTESECGHDSHLQSLLEKLIIGTSRRPAQGGCRRYRRKRTARWRSWGTCTSARRRREGRPRAES